MEIIKKIRGSGGDICEDTIASYEKNGQLFLAVFDGRRAWRENGDAAGIIRDYGQGTTGAALAKLCADMFIKGMGLLAINGEIGRILRQYGYDLSKPEGLPGCAATTAMVDPKAGQISFSHVCDTKLILFRPGSDLRWETETQSLDPEVLALTVTNAAALRTSPRQALWETDYCGSALTDPKKLDMLYRGRENISHGLGVLNGMPAMIDFLQSGEIATAPYSHLLLATDGLALPSLPNEDSWRATVRYLSAHELKLRSLLRQVRERQDSDPDFIRYPRFAARTDASGILVKL